MRGVVTDRETVELIVECAKKGDKGTKIAKDLGLDSSSVYRILHREGILESKRKTDHSKDPKTKKCPACRNTINYIYGMKFCYKCGADIRDEGDILIERLGDICKTIATFPVSEGDKAIAVINDTIAYIKKHK